MYKNATFLSILGPYKPNKSVLELWKTYFQRGPYIFQEFLILWPTLVVYKRLTQIKSEGYSKQVFRRTASTLLDYSDAP